MLIFFTGCQYLQEQGCYLFFCFCPSYEYCTSHRADGQGMVAEQIIFFHILNERLLLLSVNFCDFNYIELYWANKIRNKIKLEIIIKQDFIN